MNYPDDANGDALRRMEAAGERLTRPRDIEFTMVFPTEIKAKQFADDVPVLGHAACAKLTGTVEDFPWDAVAVKSVVPSHGEIGAFEGRSQREADAFGGRNDGWGCLSSAPDLKSTGQSQ